jgi:hypothetical protein
MGVESAAAAAPEPAGLLPNAAAAAANGVDYQMLYQRGREVFESMQQKGESVGCACCMHWAAGVTMSWQTCCSS